MHRNRSSAVYLKNKCFSLGMWYKFSFYKGNLKDNFKSPLKVQIDVVTYLVNFLLCLNKYNPNVYLLNE